MLFEIIALFLAIAGAYVIYKVLKAFVLLFVNSIIAMVALFAINLIFGFGIVINTWTILIVAIGGFWGLALVLVLKILGLAF